MLGIRIVQFPYQFWVSRLWGLPRSTSIISYRTRLCGTLQFQSIVSLRNEDLPSLMPQLPDL